MAGRAKQARKDRNEKLLKVATEHERFKKMTADETLVPQFGPGRSIVKSIVPDRGFQAKDSEIKNANLLDRGYV